MNLHTPHAGAHPSGSGRQSEREVEKIWHDVARFTLPIPEVREFQSRYESAVPDAPLNAMAHLVSRGAPWSKMVDLIARSAPYGFLIYSRYDFRPLMGLAGDRANCVAYLMGNHTIAERMFRHDPRAMMYAPLRTVIWEDKYGAAWFTFEQPRQQLASLAVPEIAEVGIELDEKLAALLEALAVAVPPELKKGWPVSQGSWARGSNHRDERGTRA